MKRKIGIAAFIAILSVLSTNIQAQFVVKVRPTVVVRARPVAPSKTHIWIEPEYVWRNNNYVMVDGYWAPARPGFAYVPGHWRRMRGGYAWVPGHWRR